ncbi:MAG: Clp protease N-terminal domain-containing protein, partial [Bradymonadaceae bacterium]
MRIDKFTIKSREALADAQDLASDQGHPEVRPIHLLDSLLEQEEGIVIPIINKLGVGTDHLREASKTALGRLPKVEGVQVNVSTALGVAQHIAQ